MNGLILRAEYANYERETPFAFSTHSSIGCGGFAPVAFYPKTVQELVSLTKRLQTDGIAFYTVGNMTNILPPDGSLRKIIVCTKKMKETDGLFFSAGVTSGELLRACKRLKKSGAEFLDGIPCTLGGALFMNAGVSGRYIAEVVESVTALQNGEIVVLPQKDCGYAYKKSVFMDGGTVILGAKLKLIDAEEPHITAQIREYRARRAHLPKGKSMGCVFKNPEGLVAGKLIEGAGLKGMRVGGAKVSEIHANFIINEENATSAQIRTLIGIVKSAVFAQYKIRLQEEIRYLV